MTITLQQLRYFLALCEERNFTRAAKRCGVSQPSLTWAIRQLEMEFGGPLFVRSRRISRLSELGMVVRPHLAAINDAVRSAKHDAAAFVAGRALPHQSTTVLPFKRKESAMRKIVIGTAITAAVLLIADMAVQAPRDAGASSPAPAGAASDVYRIEAAIDVSALPRQDILSEADE